MVKAVQILQALKNDESGQDLIEYALVAALIGLATVSAMQSLAVNISNTFTSIGTSLSTSV